MLILHTNPYYMMLAGFPLTKLLYKTGLIIFANYTIYIYFHKFFHVYPFKAINMKITITIPLIAEYLYFLYARSVNVMIPAISVNHQAIDIL